jgi:hypothetical protein
MVCAKEVPKDILLQFKISKIPSSSILFISDLTECVSCNFGYLETLSASSHYNNISIVFLNEESKSKFQQIITASKFDLKKIQLIDNELIFNYFLQRKLVKIKETDYQTIKIYEVRKIVTRNKKLELDHVEKLPTLNKSFNYDYFVLENIIYAFNRDLGELYFNRNDDTTDSFSFYDKVNVNLFLDILKLNEIDLKLTKTDLVSSKLPGNRFIDFLFYCPSKQNDQIYFSGSLNYLHRLDSVEVVGLQKNSPKNIKKQLKQVKGNITIMKNIPIVVKFDKNWNIIEVMTIDSIPENYNYDFYSPLIIDSLSIFGNIKFYPKNSDDFKEGNYAIGNYRFSKNQIKFKEFSNYVKPYWFNESKLFNNFSNYFVNFDDLNKNMCLIAYPFAIDFKRNMKIEIPIKEIKNILNFEKSRFEKKSPSFQTLGLNFSASEGYYLFIKSIKTPRTLRIWKTG